MRSSVAAGLLTVVFLAIGVAVGVWIGSLAGWLIVIIATGALTLFLGAVTGRGLGEVLKLWVVAPVLVPLGIYRMVDELLSSRRTERRSD